MELKEVLKSEILKHGLEEVFLHSGEFTPGFTTSVSECKSMISFWVSPEGNVCG